MPTRTQTVNGTTLSYHERGPASPGTAAAGTGTVLLVHGFPLDARMWEAQLQPLADAGHRVVAPDLRGFGQSRSDLPFTIESLADELHAFATSIRAVPCVLAGLSMGGYVALAVAKKYPRDLRALILADTKAEADTVEGKQGRQKMIDLARKEGSKAVADQMMPKMLAKDSAARPQLVASLRAIMEPCPPKTIEHALAAMRDRPDRSGELGSITVPTLVIVGDADAITPPDVAKSMADRIRGAQLVTIRGAGHMSPMEQPEQVNRALRSFLQSLA
jgi:pimeloyl-ACP methyl ester carboxylesterase